MVSPPCSHVRAFYFKKYLEVWDKVVIFTPEQKNSNMAKSKKKEEFESVKIKSNVVNKVRENKKVTGVPVGTFFEQAAEEKLSTKK